MKRVILECASCELVIRIIKKGVCYGKVSCCECACGCKKRSFLGYNDARLTMMRRNAACASGVTVSASSRIIILKGGFGNFFSSLSSTSMLSSPVVFLKNEAPPACGFPTARLAKFLILSRTTEMPRSSEAFNSNTRRFQSDGCHNCRQSANATDVFGEEYEKREATRLMRMNHHLYPAKIQKPKTRIKQNDRMNERSAPFHFQEVRRTANEACDLFLRHSAT